MRNLKNKIAVITGASSGIGEVFAKKLVKAGMKVYSLSNQQPKKKVSGIIYLQCDVTSGKSVKSAALKIRDKIDLLVNNAGVMRRGNLWEINEKDYDLVMNVNLKGIWLIYKNFINKLLPKAIVMQVNSKNSLLFKEDTFVYTLSKIGSMTIDTLVKKSYPNLNNKIVFFGPVDTGLEWQGYDNPEEQRKTKIFISPDEAGELLFELFNSDHRQLVYRQGKYKFLNK